MKKILIATNNKSKFDLYYSILKQIIDIEMLCLKDINLTLDIEEPFETEYENSVYKAKKYNEHTNLIVMCDDTGLYFENVPDNVQPKTKVSRINGKKAADEEIIAHYKKIVEQYGYEHMGEKRLNGYYLKTLVICKENEYKCLQYKVHKIFTNNVLDKRHEGYPLDSMSITPEFDKYTIDLSDEENLKIMEMSNKTVLEFLKDNLKIFN